jgi:hypothetical protein
MVARRPCRLDSRLHARQYFVQAIARDPQLGPFSGERLYGIATRVARYHNVYGREGTYDGGREKAPAAICRKVIAAKLAGKHEIEIWGDGEQTRSFTYIDDCTDGTIRVAQSDIIEPLNIGSDELVTINRLVDIVEKIAGVRLKRSYKLDAPKGVRGRNSDNTLIKKLMNWAPSIRLEDGLEKTYKWIHDEMTSGKTRRQRPAPRGRVAASSRLRETAQRSQHDHNTAARSQHDHNTAAGRRGESTHVV